MARWLGYIDDPTAGGSTLDDLASIAIPAPTAWIPATTAQIEPGDRKLDRNNEPRGRRANAAPVSFSAAPQLTFESRAYPSATRKFLRAAMSGLVSTTGTAPAAVTSTFGTLQSGALKTLIFWLLREGQLDRATGVCVDEIEFNFPIDEEGTIQCTCPALYHDVDDAGSATDPNGSAAVAAGTPSFSGFTDTYMLRDAKAFRGASNTEFTNLAGFGLTFNNNNYDDAKSRWQPGRNIEKVIVSGDTNPHKLWYPKRHKPGPQTVTGRIDFSDVDAAAAQRMKFASAEKLVFEVAAGPLGTTPAADDVMRLTVYKHMLTGGGADPLQRENDQTASFEFTGYIDESTNKDLEASFAGTAALT